MTSVATDGPTPGPGADVTSAPDTSKLTEKPLAPAAASGSADAPAATAGAGATPSKKMTAAAEAKAKKQAEKAQRRAQAIAAKAAAAAPPTGPASATEAPATQPTVPGASGDGAKGAKSKSKQDGPQQVPGGGRPAHGGKQAAGSSHASSQKEKKEAKPSAPLCFSHLPVAKRISLPEADRDVHHAVLALGQKMGTFALRENIARLRGTLLAFKEVLLSYEAPAGNSFSRHFVPYVLNPQIEYLTECRPMCFAMGNAIRQIKSRVSELDIETSDKTSIKTLCKAVDAFIEEKINYAEVIVTKNAADMIADGDVLLTYGHHRLVQKAMQLAWADGKRFSVVVVADSTGANGRDLAKLLHTEGVKVSYVPRLVELSGILRPGTKVMLGVESVFANGALYAPLGTSDIAAAAALRDIPVIALSESINVDRDRVAIEPLTYNEIEPDKFTGDGFRLLFDTTREEHVSVLITEFETETGNAPPSAVLAILRKQDDPN
ncbi:hypothetical protein MCOR27_003915 [Pyricularia oryzae]|uniref:Translation initiation factor eIF2B subunit delta n=3 Tax=Pyricularia TaxID=48558 RepID=A0ABQ8NYK7_PYRGI|nr:uncharacterized protein MGG_17708 [Pyricularia oryzae 70-15]ELQ39165.1 translation initiation factor eIF-2B subunit delta [Pyricularia oryzae Y34]KAH8845953.1 hypothetical protein MCOR01_003173 [Pyricularia oryzae]KAI6303484.1 hypothetical protein MCOR33_001370 [Pyricularia grisea]EHA47450.1 hypothetical protein MGG_17708 [Pyricularia oryzae 70-15]KAH9432539.1 hypothetical protein MCOR02_007231 [Pyricularia oryzae]